MLKYVFTLCLGLLTLASNGQNLLYKKAINTEKPKNTVEFATLSGADLVTPSAGTIIQALAKFQVDRTKQELDLAFIEKFRNKLKENKALQTLFPKTSLLLINGDIFNRSVWGAQIINTGREDINNLPINLVKLIKENKEYYDKLSDPEKEGVEALMVLYEAFMLQESGQAPIQTLKKIHEKYGFKSNPTKNTLIIHQALSLVYVLSESVMTADQVDYISAKDIGTNLNKELFLEEVNTMYSVTFAKAGVKSNDAQQTAFLLSGEELSNNYQSIKEAVKKLKAAGNTQEDKVQAYITILAGIKNVFEIGYKMYYTANLGYKTTYFNEIQPIINVAFDAASAVLQKNYTGALIQLSTLLKKHTVWQTQVDKVEEVNNGKGEVERKEKRQANKTLRGMQKTLKNILFLGGVLADMASLDSTSQVSDLIKKYAAPVSSYRVKRYAKLDISLNAFPGFYGGLDYIDGERIGGGGVTAPIGISLTLGNSKREKSSVWGLFVPVVDLVAPFVYQWGGGDAEGFTNELQWSQVFAPGVFILHGVRNSGLTIMLGVQRSPALRKIENNQLMFGDQNWRFGMTLTYDIPIFTLFKTDK